MRQSAQFTVALLRRIRDFLVRTQPAVALGDIKIHIETLAGIADQLSTLAIEQDTRSRQGRAGTSTLRHHVRVVKFEFMRPVSRMAQALFPDDEALRRALSMPRRLDRPEAVIAAGHAMANAAEPHVAFFVEAGLSPDFVTRMHAAADALKAAVDARAKEFGRRSAATAGAAREGNRGRALVRVIDAMVAPRLVANPELYAEWRSLLRQGRVRVTTPLPAEAPLPPAVPAVPATPPTPAPASPAAGGELPAAA